MADDVVRAAARFRRDLLAGQRKAAAAIAVAYSGVVRATDADLRVLTARIDAARAAGEPVSAAWLSRQAAYVALLARYAAQLEAVAPVVAGATATLVADAVALAEAHTAAALALTGVAPSVAAPALNVRAAVQMVALTDRGPLLALLKARAGEKAAEAAAVLTEAVIRGYSPHKTARALRRVTDGSMRNALTIARTEQMRAYREASRLSYVDNPAVSRWVWSSRLIVGRTCSYCWARHGEVVSVQRTMPTHPNCMCVMLPWVEDVDYGLTGPERFAQLTADERVQVLGPAAAAAFEDGALSLRDLVGTSRHPSWGLVGHARSLTDVLGDEAAPYLRSARLR